MSVKQQVLAFVGLVVVGLAIKIAWASYVYDDWRCAFAECRLEK